MKSRSEFSPILNLPFEIIDSKSQTVDLKLLSPMKLPFGEISSRPSGVIKVTARCDNGKFIGFGEGATLQKPLFTDDFGGNISSASDELLEVLKGSKISFKIAVDIIRSHVFSDQGNHPTARMMVEMSLIDLLSKSRKTSVADLLEIPKSVDEVPFGKSLGGGIYDDICREAKVAIEKGAKKIKLKVTPDSAETIVNVITSLKTSYPNIELMVDANGSFDPMDKEHLEKLRILDKTGLIMIEEPSSRSGSYKGIDAIIKLRQAINFQTRVCLDDCLTNLEITNLSIKEGLADIVNIKPGRIGSITTSLDIATNCATKGLQVMVGGMLEATPGRTMTTVLAAYFHHHHGFDIPGDLSLAQERLSSDLVSTPNMLKIGKNGGIVLPRKIGWGY